MRERQRFARIALRTLSTTQPRSDRQVRRAWLDVLLDALAEPLLSEAAYNIENSKNLAIAILARSQGQKPN